MSDMEGHTTEFDALDDDTAQLGTGATRQPDLGKTALDRIRQRYTTGSANDTTDIDVPGYEGDVAVRYRVLPFEDARRIEMAAAREPDSNAYRELRVMMDELIHACDSIIVRVEGGDMVPLTDNGDLIRFDSRLAEAFGLDYAEEARDVLLGLFAAPVTVGRDRGPHMVARHYEDYLSWLRNPDRVPGSGE